MAAGERTERLVKPKTALAARVLKKRAPKTVESVKKALLLHAGKTSQVLKDLLTDLGTLKAHESLKLSRTNEGVRPFEVGGEVSLEFLARKADCSLFALGSHSKKRPHNLTLGRLFDFRLLDLAEFGVRASSEAGSRRPCSRRSRPAQVENFRPIKAFGSVASRAALGSKPCLVFLGDGFETDATLRLAKSLLLDLFRGRVVPNVNLKGLDRVLLCTAVGQRVLVRQCTTRFKKSGGRLPRLELDEMGPSFDLVARRSREAPPELRKAAMAQAKAPKRVKNVGEAPLVGTVGRVFVPAQQVEELGLSKPKGVKRGRREAAVEGKLARRAAGAADGAPAAPRVQASKRARGEAAAAAPPGGFPGSGGSAGNVTVGKGLKKPKRLKRAREDGPQELGEDS